MATMCRTVDGDLLDAISYAHYRHLNGCLEAVLDTNPGLADEPQPFRAGVVIRLPDLPAQEVQGLQLWS